MPNKCHIILPIFQVQRPALPHIFSSIRKHLYLVIPASGDILILTNIKILSRFPGQEPDIFPRSYLIWKDLNFSSRSIKAHFIKGFHFYHFFVFLSLQKVDVSIDFRLQSSIVHLLLTFTNELLWSHGWFSPQNSFKEISRDPWRAHYFRPRLNFFHEPD